MMAQNRTPLAQILVFDPDGRREVLWAEPDIDDCYVLLSVPIHVYGVSLGTRVTCRGRIESYLKFERVAQVSPGGTVRAILPEAVLASNWYLTEFLPRASTLNLGVGPATFFDPMMVAIHVRNRNQVWEDVGALMTELEARGNIQQWVAVDPEENQDAKVVDLTLRGDGAPSHGALLIHREPTSANLQDLGIHRMLKH